jgi:thiamine biosynthesis protein ThiS
MEIKVNGVARHLDGPLTVAELLSALKLPQIGVAVERNREIVKRETYEATPVRDGDELEIVTLVGGG